MKKPNYFQLFIDNREQFELLSDAQAGRLMKALFAYAESGELPELEDDQCLRIMFSFLRGNIDREFENYDRRCEQNRANAKKKYAVASDRIQEEEKEEEKEKEKEEEKEEEKDSLSGEKEILESFNRLCPSLPKVNKLTKRRRGAIKKALRDWSAQELCHAFELVSGSSFLCGEKGGWQADFDWIMQPDNLLRIMEGSYADPVPQPQFERNYDIDELEEINRMDYF